MQDGEMTLLEETYDWFTTTSRSRLVVDEWNEL